METEVRLHLHLEGADITLADVQAFLAGAIDDGVPASALVGDSFSLDLRW